ncbi:hypothetical protein ACPA9J_08260 [Pseudomonas aeruginosa]
MENQVGPGRLAPAPPRAPAGRGAGLDRQLSFRERGERIELTARSTRSSSAPSTACSASSGRNSATAEPGLLGRSKRQRRRTEFTIRRCRRGGCPYVVRGRNTRWAPRHPAVCESRHRARSIWWLARGKAAFHHQSQRGCS